MSDFMKFLGTITAFLVLFSAFNYVIKGINKKYRKEIQAGSYKNVFNTLMKFTVKNHKLLGIMAIITGTFHGLYQLNSYGFNISIGFILAGVITLLFIYIQIILGFYGHKVMKSKRGLWFYSHRFVAVIIVLGLLLHNTLVG